jgi:hypothetical protein
LIAYISTYIGATNKIPSTGLGPHQDVIFLMTFNDPQGTPSQKMYSKDFERNHC